MTSLLWLPSVHILFLKSKTLVRLQFIIRSSKFQPFGLHMNKNELLKNFSIGFLPVLVFIIADEFFGTRIGLTVAVVFGCGELLYYYFVHKRIERFVLFDTGLIIIMGGVSIALDNDLLFKLKPALIEGILVVLLGVHAFSQKPLLLIMGQRYFKSMHFQPAQLQQMQKIVRVLFFVILFHTGLIVWSAYRMSHEAWAFISGGLFYIIFGLVIAGQWVWARFFKKIQIQYKAEPGEEWFDLVDQDGNVTGKAPRSAVHGNPGLLHPAVHLHVFNRQGQLYLQKRAENKDVQPGKWDTSVGGHILSGERVEDALLREAKEELGLKNFNYRALYRYIMRNDFESELVYTFRTTYNGAVRVNRDEIQFGRFWSLREIDKNLKKNIFTPNFEQEFNLLKEFLERSKKNKIHSI